MSEQNTIQALRAAGGQVHQQGWTPATSGNLSARRDAQSMYLFVSVSIVDNHQDMVVLSHIPHFLTLN